MSLPFLVNPNGLMFFFFFWAASSSSGFTAPKKCPPYLPLKNWVCLKKKNWRLTDSLGRLRALSFPKFACADSELRFESSHVKISGLNTWHFGFPCLSCHQGHRMWERERGREKHSREVGWRQGTRIASFLSYKYIYICMYLYVSCLTGTWSSLEIWSQETMSVSLRSSEFELVRSLNYIIHV